MTPSAYNKKASVLLETSRPAFRAILFDWGGVFTLARRSTSPTEQLERNLGIPQGTLSKRLYDNEYWTQAQIGEITDQEFWRRTLQQFHISDEQGIARFKAALFKGESSRLRTGMVNLVKQLKRNYIVALLSNADNIFRDLLKIKFHADQLFHDVIISAEVGVAKPDPTIFTITCDKLKVEKKECIFIDDSARNVESAISVGIHAIQYRNTVHLRKELKQLGVSF
jgi:epoxide hydrolase-like predicted phosphatase